MSRFALIPPSNQTKPTLANEPIHLPSFCTRRRRSVQVVDISHPPLSSFLLSAGVSVSLLARARGQSNFRKQISDQDQQCILLMDTYDPRVPRIARCSSRARLTGRPTRHAFLPALSFSLSLSLSPPFPGNPYRRRPKRERRPDANSSSPASTPNRAGGRAGGFAQKPPTRRKEKGKNVS